MAEKVLPTGLQRREIWIDARDLQSDSDPDNPLTPEEYIAVLNARGKQKLAECQLVQSFSVQVRELDPTYAYGVDYQLGDTITATDENLGVSVNAVVQGVQRSVSGTEEGLTLTLGYGQPTLHDILRRKAGK